MNKTQLKQLIAESVIAELNEATQWQDIEQKIGKWFNLSPGLSGNLQQLDARPAKHGATDIILKDKRGNIVVLVPGASTEFTDKYLPILGNVLSVVAGQEASRVNDRQIKFT